MSSYSRASRKATSCNLIDKNNSCLNSWVQLFFLRALAVSVWPAAASTRRQPSRIKASIDFSIGFHHIFPSVLLLISSPCPKTHPLSESDHAPWKCYGQRWYIHGSINREWDNLTLYVGGLFFNRSQKEDLFPNQTEPETGSSVLHRVWARFT